MAKDRKGPCLLARPIPSGERASAEIAPVRKVPQVPFPKWLALL